MSKRAQAEAILDRVNTAVEALVKEMPSKEGKPAPTPAQEIEFSFLVGVTLAVTLLHGTAEEIDHVKSLFRQWKLEAAASQFMGER